MTPDEKPRRRKLSAEDEALWRGVTRAVSPLRRGPRADRDAEIEAEPVEKPARTPASGAIRPAPRPIRVMPKELPLAPLDRRAKQRLARGTDAIDARLDLHGRTQEEAHDALLRFLRRQQDRGAKTVLVITGKGGPLGDTGRGVLRRQVPQWLALPEFRRLVLSVDTASAAHGGEGALYVRIRKLR
jgi:DNA-nicking Smr family endonuclease